MRLPPSTDPYVQIEPIEFCVIKRANIAMYTLKERLVLQRVRHSRFSYSVVIEETTRRCGTS